MVEVRIVQKGGAVGDACAEGRERIGVGDLGGRQQEGVDPDPVDGTLAILAGVGAHQEPAAGIWTRVGSSARPKFWAGVNVIPIAAICL